MPITFYHILHLVSLLALSGFGYGLVFSEHKKYHQIGFGVASLLVFIAGFGLMAKLGYRLGTSHWLMAKLAIWVVLSAGVPMVVKRLSLPQWLSAGLVTLLLSTAVALVYLK